MGRILAGLLLQFLLTLPSTAAGHLEYDLTYSSLPDDSEAFSWAGRGQACGNGSASDAVCGDGLCCSIHVRIWY